MRSASNVCVSENNCDCGAEKSARESVCQCTHTVRIVALRLSIRRRSNTILLRLICVAATGLPEQCVLHCVEDDCGEPQTR